MKETINLIIKICVLVFLVCMVLLTYFVFVEYKNKQTVIAYDTNIFLGRYCDLLGQYEPQERLHSSDCNWYSQEEMWRENINTEYDDEIKAQFWHCKVVVDCEWSDWAYTKPEDACKYEYKIIESIENPVKFESYGGYCELKSLKTKE